MKKIYFYLISLFILFSIQDLKSQNSSEVFLINQDIFDKISLFKGESITGDYKYEKRSDSKRGILNYLNDSLGNILGIMIKANLSICTDGSPDDIQENCTYSELECVDQNYISETAYSLNDKPLNADKISYLVLPGHERPRPYSDWGFKKGDIGVIINMDNNENKLIFAIFGEVGPNDQVGEASIYASKKLGHCPCNGRNRNLASINDNVYYIVFRNTKNELLQMNINQNNLNQKITELGLKKMKEYFNIELE